MAALTDGQRAELQAQTDQMVRALLQVVHGEPMIAALAATKAVAHELEVMLECERKRGKKAFDITVNVTR